MDRRQRSHLSRGHPSNKLAEMEILGGVSEPSGLSEPGAHTCLVFDDPRERIDRAVTWVQLGLDRGERLVYVEAPGQDGSFTQELAEAGLDVSAPLRDGQLVLLPAAEALLAEGDWDVERRMALHERFVHESLDAGFSAVRMAAEAAPALTLIPSMAELRRYEQGMEALTQRLPVSVMCFYERRAFAAELGGFALIHPRGIEDRQMRVFAKPGHVTMVGEVDFSNSELMTQVLDEAVPVDGRVVVDLGAVSFIDVGGAGRLVELARRLGGPDRVRIVDPPRQLGRILAAADWQDELEMVAGDAA